MSQNDVPNQIAEDLKRLGVKKGTPLLVHASVKSLGIDTRALGLEPVIVGLLKAVGEEGTKKRRGGDSNPRYRLLSTTV